MVTDLLAITFMVSVGLGLHLARRTRRRQWPLWLAAAVGLVAIAVLLEEPDPWAPMVGLVVLWTAEVVVDRRVPPAPSRGHLASG
jgi:hypothetical protein